MKDGSEVSTSGLNECPPILPPSPINTVLDLFMNARTTVTERGRLCTSGSSA